MTTQIIFFSDGTSQTLVSKPPAPSVPTLPPGRIFGRLIHDYERYGVSRPTHNGSANHVLGLPETVKVLYPVFMPMTKAWQFFAADLLSLARFGLTYTSLNLTQQYAIKIAFRSTYVGFRAFTNGHGWNNGYHDCINGVNTDKPPMEQETINTGGNLVELFSRSPMRMGGKDVYKVHQLDGTNPPPSIANVNQTTMPWLVVKATNSQRVKILNSAGVWTGKWIEDVVEPFPQNDGRDVPVAFMGKGPFNYIEKDRIEVLPDSSPIPPVYHSHQY